MLSGRAVSSLLASAPPAMRVAVSAIAETEVRAAIAAADSALAVVGAEESSIAAAVRRVCGADAGERVEEEMARKEWKAKHDSSLLSLTVASDEGSLVRVFAAGTAGEDVLLSDCLASASSSSGLPDSCERHRRAAAGIAKAAVAAKLSNVAVLPVGDDGNASAAALAAMSEGAQLATAEDLRWKTDGAEGDGSGDETASVVDVQFVAATGADEALAAAQHAVAASLMARQLVNTPPTQLTPPLLAEVASAIADDDSSGRMTCTVLDAAACEAAGMGALLAVGRGSAAPPCLIHMHYRGDGEAKKRLAVVGKGITFDSGGYNLKPGGAQMELMKFDMGGAAATLGAAHALAARAPAHVEAHFVVAAAENMVSDDAYRPGDILTASDGTTIEVLNTDAEGRLALADALTYLRKQTEGEDGQQQLDAVVDLATLTGACVVALGDDIAGLWSTTLPLQQSLLRAAAASNEPTWAMPLYRPYADGLKSKLADVSNIGGRMGGAITAALFLQRFAPADAWAHLDIAGPVWTEKGTATAPAGATGFGARLLLNWLCESEEEAATEA